MSAQRRSMESSEISRKQQEPQCAVVEEYHVYEELDDAKVEQNDVVMRKVDKENENQDKNSDCVLNGLDDDDESDGIPSDVEDFPEWTAVDIELVRRDFTCLICQDILQETKMLKNCLHRFCKKCIENFMATGKKTCPTCRTHYGSRRTLRNDPSMDSIISMVFGDINKYGEEVTKRGAAATRSHNRYRSSSATKRNKTTCLTKLDDHLHKPKEDEDEFEVQLKLVSFDKDLVGNLERPHLFCSSALSVHHLREYVARFTPLRARDVELFVVKEAYVDPNQASTSRIQRTSLAHEVGYSKVEHLRQDNSKTLADLLARCPTENGKLTIAFQPKNVV